MAAVQQDIAYRKELYGGDVVIVRTTMLEVRDKVIRFVHEMVNGETGDVAATCTFTVVCLDAAERRARAFPDDVLERARALLAGDALASVLTHGDRRRARHARAAPVRGAAAAVAVHPPAVVPEEVPVLRLQLARVARRPGRRRSARGRLRRRARRRPRARAAGGVGAQGRHGVPRRRHAEPLLARGDRPAARRACARAFRCRPSPR